MPKVKFPAASGADSFLAEIRERKQPQEKKENSPEEKKTTDITVESTPNGEKEFEAEKKTRSNKKANSLVIPPQQKREAKAATITIRLTKSMKKKFQEKCERENVPQNYILENLIELWVESQS